MITVYPQMAAYVMPDCIMPDSLIIIDDLCNVIILHPSFDNGNHRELS